METFSALLAISAGNSPVPGEFPAQRPVTRSFDVFFDLHPNKRLSNEGWHYYHFFSQISYRSNMRRFQIMLTRGPLVDRNENLHK